MITVALILSICWLAYQAGLWALRQAEADEARSLRQHRAASRALGEAVNRCKH